MWMKYRKRWSSGIDKEWVWEELGDSVQTVEAAHADAKERVIEINNDHAFDEHYRGVEHEICGEAPREVLEQEVVQALRNVVFASRSLERLKRQLGTPGFTAERIHYSREAVPADALDATTASISRVLAFVWEVSIHGGESRSTERYTSQERAEKALEELGFEKVMEEQTWP